MKITIEIGKEKHILKKGNYFYDDHCKKCSLKGQCGQGADNNERQISIYRICSLTNCGFRKARGEE